MYLVSECLARLGRKIRFAKQNIFCTNDVVEVSERSEGKSQNTGYGYRPGVCCGTMWKCNVVVWIQAA